MKRFLVLVAFAAISNMAHAAIVQVFAAGSLGPGPTTVETFEGAIGSGVTYSAAGGTRVGTACGFAGCGTPSGSLGLTTNVFPRAITMAFAAPTSSVGMFFGNDDTCCSGGFTAFLDVFDVGGLIGTVSVVANMNDLADQFIGFTSNEMVTSVVIRYGSGSNVGLFHYIDDVRYNVASLTAIPEPGSLGLAGLALAVLGAATRRRAVKG